MRCQCLHRRPARASRRPAEHLVRTRCGYEGRRVVLVRYRFEPDHARSCSIPAYRSPGIEPVDSVTYCNFACCVGTWRHHYRWSDGRLGRRRCRCGLRGGAHATARGGTTRHRCRSRPWWIGRPRRHSQKSGRVAGLCPCGGTGDGPESPRDTAYFDLDITAETIDQALRATIVAVKDPPAAAITAIDEFDPDGTRDRCRRHVQRGRAHERDAGSVSYRRPDWVALEDKVVIDACWERWGVARSPSVVVETHISSW